MFDLAHSSSQQQPMNSHRHQFKTSDSFEQLSRYD